MEQGLSMSAANSPLENEAAPKDAGVILTSESVGLTAALKIAIDSWFSRISKQPPRPLLLRRRSPLTKGEFSLVSAKWAEGPRVRRGNRVREASFICF